MEKLILTFQRFAHYEAKGKSPLYEYWCNKIISHEPLLNLIKNIPISQPKPNLFFASVQYLSMKNPCLLTAVFEEPEHVDFEKSFQLLVQFCMEHQQALIELFQTKLVQTNEVQRASYLYPIFSEIASAVNKPLTLIEIGTSAGLLLNLDYYHYEIKQNPPIYFGNTNNPLTLQAENLGQPLLKLEKPIIQTRMGIDLNIIDLEDEEQYQWLNCLIWPELKHRKTNLEIARQIHQQCPKKLLAGDFREILQNVIKDEMYKESQIVIFHTHVANQFSIQLKDDLMQLLNQISTKQSIYHVYNNMYDANLHVDLIENRIITSVRTLKNIDGHGNYFYWE
ncbi:DUF2332 domain-containing protein [Lysinibacillus xylanilyticus]|uniref:DUF2332 domain-containing protein n=1 Tax=Lysinibacillus xylanilyticus TaxID=582475 RepID=UPI003D04BAF6